MKEQLPSQILLNGVAAREDRLLKIISGTAQVSITSLLLRQCPDPPSEVDPDTDDESKNDKHEYDHATKPKCKQFNGDPTTRPWTTSDSGPSSPYRTPFSPLHPPPLHTTYTRCMCSASGVTLEISEKQRVSL